MPVSIVSNNSRLIPRSNPLLIGALKLTLPIPSKSSTYLSSHSTLLSLAIPVDPSESMKRFYNQYVVLTLILRCSYGVT